MPTSFKIILTGILLVIIGLFWGVNDLRLKISGRKTIATITDISETNNGRLMVNYTFSDETGGDRSGVCYREAGWVPPADFKLPILHFHDHPESAHIATDVGYTGLWVFLLGIALTAGGFWYFSRESVVEAHAQTARDIEDATDPTKQLKRALRKGLR